MRAINVRWRAAAAAGAAVLAAGCSTAPTEFHVAPDGSDANPGTRARPFATLPRAMEAVRAARAAMDGGRAPAAPIAVRLRGGVYELRSPLVFTPADGGTPGAPVTWASAPGERAILSGGTRLTGVWTRVPGRPYWRLDVPAARDGRWVFHSLF